MPFKKLLGAFKGNRCLLKRVLWCQHEFQRCLTSFSPPKTFLNTHTKPFCFDKETALKHDLVGSFPQILAPGRWNPEVLTSNSKSTQESSLEQKVQKGTCFRGFPRTQLCSRPPKEVNTVSKHKIWCSRFFCPSSIVHCNVSVPVVLHTVFVVLSLSAPQKPDQNPGLKPGRKSGQKSPKVKTQV